MELHLNQIKELISQFDLKNQNDNDLLHVYMNMYGHDKFINCLSDLKIDYEKLSANDVAAQKFIHNLNEIRHLIDTEDNLKKYHNKQSEDKKGLNPFSRWMKKEEETSEFNMDDFNHLKEEIVEFHEKEEKFKKTIKDFNSDNTLLRESLAQEKKHREEIEKKYKEVKEGQNFELLEIKSDNEQIKSKNLQLIEDVNRMISETRSLSSDKEELNDKIISLESEMRQAEEKYHEEKFKTETIIEQLELEKNQQQKLFSEIEIDRIKIKKMFDDLEKEHQIKCEENDSLRNTLKITRENLEKSSNDMLELKEASYQIQSELEGARNAALNDLQALQQVFDTTVEKMDFYEDALIREREQHKELVDELKRQKDINNLYESDNEAAKNTALNAVEKINRELHDVSLELQEAKYQLSEERQRNRFEREQLEKQKESAIQSQLDAEGERNRTINEHEKLKKTLSIIKDKYDHLSSHYEVVVRDLKKDAESSIKQKDAALKDQADAEANRNKTLNDFEKSKLNMKIALEKFEFRENKFNQEVDNLKMKIVRMQKDIDGNDRIQMELKADKKYLEDDLIKAKTVIKNTLDKLSTAENKLERERLQFKDKLKSISQAKVEKDTAGSDAIQKVELLKKDVERYTNAIKSLKEKYERETMSLKSEISKTAQQSALAQSQKKEAQDDLKNIRTKVNTLEIELNSANAKVRRLQAEIEQRDMRERGK